MECSEQARYVTNAAKDFFERGIRDSLGHLPSAIQIVDLGPGNGKIIDIFRDMGFEHIECVDVANHLANDLKSEVTLHTCNLACDPLPYADASLDVITAFQVIEHVENPWHMVREVRRCLKPDGLFLVSYPVSRDVCSRVRFLVAGDVLHFTETNSHISFFTAAVEKKLFAGFKEDARFGAGGCLPGFRKLQRLLKIKWRLLDTPYLSSKCLRVLRPKPHVDK